MQKSRVQYFRWTPRNARITFMYVAVIPTIMGYIAYNTDVSRKLTRTNTISNGPTLGSLGSTSEEKGRYRIREINGESSAVV